MRYTPKIHSLKHAVKSITGSVAALFGNNSYPGKEFLVLNYHGTQKKFIGEFEKQLDLLSRQYVFAGPEQLQLYLAGQLNASRPHILLTFDDGIRNNLHAVALLDKRNIKAVFFIIPGFVETAPGQQKEFFLKNIRPQIDPNIDSEEEDLTALSWSELKAIAANGHEIGSHTFTHTLVSARSGIENSAYEIRDSRSMIEKMTGLPVRSFCSPNNSLLSIGKKELDLVRKHYTCLHTTIPGSNEDRDPFFIRRSNVEAFWMRGAFLNAIGKLDRARWKKNAGQYQLLTLKK
jgi:peptidoglycan/xylan/chitin deacetylase (PgdA/CDA1 family)